MTYDERIANATAGGYWPHGLTVSSSKKRIFGVKSAVLAFGIKIELLLRDLRFHLC